MDDGREGFGCYHIRGDDGESVLIPGCWMAVHSNECWCREQGIRPSPTNDELEARIEALEQIVAHLKGQP